MNPKTLALLAFTTLTIASCKREEEVPPTTTPPAVTTGTIKMAFDFIHGAVPFDMAATYQDGAGHAIRFDAVKFYASDFHFDDDAGDEIGAFHNAVILVDASSSTNEITLGSMSVSSIHMVHLLLGLESEVNHADPTLASAPLNDPSMHWSWNTSAGYKFLLMEGRVDGNGDGDVDDAEDATFTYHCATDAMARELMAHMHTDVTAGATSTIQATVNMATLLTGLDFLTNGVAMGGGPQNEAAMDNLQISISGM